MAEDWLKDITAHAKEKAKKILKEHQPVPMDKSVTSELERYIKKESKTYGL